jgi:hypothetical protein
MSVAHFYDISTLIYVESGNAWVVDKKNPNIPIMKISKSDLRLMQSGIWKSQGNKIEFNGKIFWIPTDIYNQIKIKTKIVGANFANLAISLQEFLNPEIISNNDFRLRTENIMDLKNKVEDIYLICSKLTKKLWEPFIEKLMEKLEEEGIKIKNYYYISDHPIHWENDDTQYKKLRLLIQHLVGYKTDGQKFSDEKIDRYSRVNYFDTELDTLTLESKINPLLNFLIQNSPEGFKSIIKEDLKDFKPKLTINRISDNDYNRLDSVNVILETGNIIKAFENFRYKRY